MTSYNFEGDKVIECSDCAAWGKNVHSQQFRTHPRFHGGFNESFIPAHLEDLALADAACFIVIADIPFSYEIRG